MSDELRVDVLIVGGGTAGLWTLARLRGLGFSCVLVEARALGAGQTVASQGIIHGGLKYALDGSAGEAARAIAEMPGVWRACLAGSTGAAVDLRGVGVLSEHYHYWTAPGVLARVAGAGASKVLRTSVERVAAEDRPRLLREAPAGLGGVDVYRVGEMVLDARALVLRLAELGRGRIVHAELAEGARLDGERMELRCADGSAVHVRARAVVLAAGAGNEPLLRNAGEAAVRTQRRPLHMVMLRDAPGELHAHCVGAASTPRLTITSGRTRAWRAVWYIGGQVAEAGVGRGREEQIEAAKEELCACMPWVRVGEGARWATLRIDRAEGVPVGTAAGARPDAPVVVRVGERAIAAWPTKLAFAPLMADEVIAKLGVLGVAAAGGADEDLGLLVPPIAPHPWDAEGLEWS